MCGIVGYVGNKQVVPVILDGLRKLEYRGYDSAGIAVVDEEHQLDIRRAEGKLRNLEEAIRLKPLDGTYGIGHTRWATHGRPTEENAHPHRDCTGQRRRRPQRHHRELHPAQRPSAQERPRLRHRDRHRGRRAPRRGVPERGRLVREGRRARGARPARHLRALHHLDRRARHHHRRPPGAARRHRPRRRRVLRRLRRAADPPTHARRVLPRRRRAGRAHEGLRARHRLRRRRGRAARRSASPGTRSWPRRAGSSTSCSRRFTSSRAPCATPCRAASLWTPAASTWTRWTSRRDEFKSFDRVLIAACGTSWHAGLAGKYMIEQLARVPVEVDYASEFRYRDPVMTERTLLVVISQSGETADTIAALREAKQHGSKVLAICNVQGSMITRESDGTILTHAGPGDRRRLDEGVHVADDRALPLRDVPGPVARHALGRRVEAPRAAVGRAARQDRAPALASRTSWKSWRASSTARPTSSTSAAASTSPSRSKARSS